MMKSKNKKGGYKHHLFIRKTLRVILISILSISCWEIGKKQISYYKNINAYNKIEQQKNNTDNMKQFLKDNDFDWITVTGTSIDYPLLTCDNNEYYMYHNYKDEVDIGGSIFYDCYDKPFNGTLTIIYGHSMRNGTMFNNLHYFQQDHERFNNSELIITTEEETKTYVPLAYYVTDDDFFYKDLDNKSTSDVVDIIEKKSDYFNKDVEIPENAHIVILYTCDYSESKDGRLVVFYIEVNN